MQPSPHQPLLAHLVDLVDQMERDAALDEQTLRGRDRPIGKALTHPTNDRRTQIIAWLNQVRDSNDPSRGRQAVQAQHLINLVLVIVGLIAGGATAAGVFYYDGSHPVNVLTVLAVFVGLQWLLLFLFVLTVLPRRVLRWIPGAESVQQALRVLSPGPLQLFIARWLALERRQALAAAIGRERAHQALYHRVRKWALVRWSQAFALSFNIGALAVCLCLIAFKDLAFGWSTTLQLKAGDIHHLTNVLTAPWSRILPAAHPPPVLIEATRYFRLRDGLLPHAPVDTTDPSVLGQWWPFLVLCMVCYGLLPRLFTVVLARWRFATAVSHAFLHAPGVTQLLDRLNRQWVQTQAIEPEIEGPPTHTIESSASHDTDSAQSGWVINWSGVPLDDAAVEQIVGQRLGLNVHAILNAGGAQSPEQDENVVREIASGNTSDPIVILVKGWEPPMLEFTDLLRDLREGIGAARVVTVVTTVQPPEHPSLPPLAKGGRFASAHDGDELAWQQAIQSMGDPWLTHRSLNAEDD